MLSHALVKFNTITKIERSANVGVLAIEVVSFSDEGCSNTFERGASGKLTNPATKSPPRALYANF